MTASMRASWPQYSSHWSLQTFDWSERIDRSHSTIAPVHSQGIVLKMHPRDPQFKNKNRQESYFFRGKSVPPDDIPNFLFVPASLGGGPM